MITLIQFNTILTQILPYSLWGRKENSSSKDQGRKPKTGGGKKSKATQRYNYKYACDESERLKSVGGKRRSDMIIRPVYNGIFQKSKGSELGKGKGEKRVTWGHNIVADGWAGASKP